MVKCEKIFYYKSFIILQFTLNLFLLTISISKDFEIIKIFDLSNENVEDMDSRILFPIQNRLKGIIELTFNEQKFLNGLIRRYRPKKILEIGVSAGGSSALILNAIKDFQNTKLYSIDRYNNWYRNPNKNVGWLIKEKFPELMENWTLFTGKNNAEFIETIGNNIDFAFIDTFHFTPGEMLNWLEILPFLKQEAIVVFHDTFLMFVGNFIYEGIKSFSNNQLLCYIRGNLILPLYGDKIFSRNIAALKLAKNQEKYYRQYFIALGNQWQYLPEEKDILILRKHFIKYYGVNYVEIFDDAVYQNRLRFKYKKY